MQKYNKPEMEIVNLEEIDVITTSGEDLKDDLITWGNMSQNINSTDVNLFR